MPSTTSLINQLRHDFPDLTFSPSSTFSWSPEERIVYYSDETDITSLLHEVSHAALEHTEYAYDIELIKMERQASDHAITLAKRYEAAMDTEKIETMLDTYRDWLHSRSLCPNCEATGIQVAVRQYSCLACTSTWRVNEARSCALRRYKLSQATKQTKK